MQKNEARPLAIGLLILGALIRVTQHWNFAPVGALSLFAGARLRGWKAWALPLALMAITDPLLGGYSVATPLVYASFLINVWIGSRLPHSGKPLGGGAPRGGGGGQRAVLSDHQFRLACCQQHVPAHPGRRAGLLHGGRSVLLAHAGVRPG